MLGHKLSPGDVWSLSPAKGMEDEPGPLVVLDQDEHGRWIGLPLFSSGLLATDRDVLLSEDPDWLNGERWCAALDGVPVKEEQLRICVTRLPQETWENLRAFRRGEKTVLKRGMRLLPELHDPRVALRERWLAAVQRYAKPRASKPPVSDVLVHLLRDMKGNVMAALQPQAAGVVTGLACAGSLMGGAIGLIIPSVATIPGALLSKLLALSKAERSPYQFKVCVGNYQVTIFTQYGKGGWQLALEVEASKVWLERPGGRIALERAGSTWILPQVGSLPDGHYSFVIEGEKGVKRFELVVEDKGGEETKGS